MVCLREQMSSYLSHESNKIAGRVKRGNCQTAAVFHYRVSRGLLVNFHLPLALRPVPF